MKEYKERKKSKYWDKAARLESWECQREEEYKMRPGMKEYKEGKISKYWGRAVRLEPWECQMEEYKK